MKLSTAIATILGIGVLQAGFACYYNHELTIGAGDEATFFSWRDVASGPTPGIGFQIAHEDLVFELEADELTGVSIGDQKYEFSVPFTFNAVDLHEKSLCNWGYGCAHCQHIADDACSRRLSAISTISDHVNGVGKEAFPEALPDAFKTMSTELEKLCRDDVKSDAVGEDYVTNEIVENCKDACLSV